MGASGYLFRVGTLGALMTAMVALSAAVAAAEGLPDASCQDENGEYHIAFGANVGTPAQNVSLAQTFTAINSGPLTSVLVPLVDYDDTGTVVMEIRAVDGTGAPSATVLASTSIHASQIPNLIADTVPRAVSMSGVFRDWYEVRAGQQYALVLRSSDGTFAASFNRNPDACSGMGYRSTDGGAFTQTPWVYWGFSTFVEPTPAAANDTYSTAQGTPLRVAAPGLLTNDSDAAGDALTAVEVADPAHGEVFVNANGSFAYFPDEGYVGTDSFTYKASDGALRSGAATVEIAVKDTTEPTVSAMSPRHASTTRDTTPTIRATVKDNTHLAKADIKLHVAGRPIPETKYSYTASTGALVHNSPRLSKGKKTVKIVATDAAGNALTKSWYFTIKR